MSDSEVTVDGTLLESNVEHLSKMGGRKFLLSIFVILLASILCWFGKIEDGIFSVIAVTVITAFSVANVTQKFNSK